MIERIAIYYFSGTGNTEIVAKMINEQFLKSGILVDLVRIEDVLKNNLKINTTKYDLIGIGNPIIGYGAPKIIYDFIKLMPDEQDKNVFVFKTAGGVAPINYYASKPLIKKLSKKGYHVFYDRIFSISSNWVIKFEDYVTRQLYQTTKQKVKIMCSEIIIGKTRFLKTKFPLTVNLKIINFFNKIIFRLVGKDYRVKENCNLCRKCIKNCPVENIYEKSKKIKFKFSCLSCMRCVYNCPQNAIYLKLFSFFVLPGGYNIKNILEKPDTSGICPEKTPPFFQNYIQDNEL